MYPRSRSLGFLPNSMQCSDVIGQIQQFLNIAVQKKRLSGNIAVTGYFDDSTKAGLSTIVPNWSMQLDTAALRMLKSKIADYTNATPEAAFSCSNPSVLDSRPAPQEPIKLDLKTMLPYALAVGGAFLISALIKSKS